MYTYTDGMGANRINLIDFQLIVKSIKGKRVVF
jgi:hypothetical protein